MKLGLLQGLIITEKLFKVVGFEWDLERLVRTFKTKLLTHPYKNE